MSKKLTLIVITLWVGALWMTGLSAYLLFDTLQDKQMAGRIAGKLFLAVSWISIEVQSLVGMGLGFRKIVTSDLRTLMLDCYT